ncbi:MFS transporter [Scytonema sp. HK-05]|uniref:MFS transporter n=1 Tax=Scytonema sp. HK-05 TaxID=1137095 RepID=UPI001E63E570|nr:MFS transporter [Scytonema sp. HK-05]
MIKNTLTVPKSQDQRERLLRLLVTATFLIFFQAYMVAPLIPHLAVAFKVSSQTIGLIVPAYLIPYGIGSLIYGLLSDQIGRRRIILTSLVGFVVLTCFTTTAQSASQLIFWRFLTGLCASGVIPLALTLIGDIYPYERRGRPMGWIFGAMAGGMAFGSTFGALLEPLITWRGIFIGVGILGALVLSLLYLKRHLLGNATRSTTNNIRDLLTTYKMLLGSGRGQQTYAYVLLNGIFHSGVYTWLGLYFQQRYGLGEVGIGLALLGYGVPGFLLGPMIGRAVDRWGRSWLLPTGFAIAGVAAAILMFHLPLVVAAVAVTLLSLGYDMTQPLLAGIVTSLGGKRGGQAMGLNVFTLFIGFGVGSFLFGEVLRLGLNVALFLFAAIILVAALAAIPLFRSEAPNVVSSSERT